MNSLACQTPQVGRDIRQLGVHAGPVEAMLIGKEEEDIGLRRTVPAPASPSG